MKNVFKRIFKTLLISLLVTFFAMIILMISNKIMGVDRVGIAYILLGGLCFSMLFTGLILARFDYIFKKTQPKNITNKQVKRNTQSKKTPQRNIHRKSHKREIS